MKMLYSHLATKNYVKALYKEGATQPVAYQYIYDYTDHFEGGALKKCPVNIFSERASLSRWQRLAYSLDEETNQVKTLEENHYYARSIEFKEYNLTHQRK